MAIKRITTNLIKDSDIATVDIANNAITAAKITDGNITTAKLADLSVTAGKLAGTLDLTGKTITVATATTGDNDTSPASTAFVQQEIAALVDSSPDSLNTLNELAAALGDDASFSTTVTNSIATKAPLAGPTFTGDVDIDGTDSLRYRMLNSGTFKGGIEVATTNGDMIATSVVDDLAIRSQANMLFSSGGNTERMRIDSSGNVGINTSSPTSYANSQATLVIQDSTSPAIAWSDTGQTRDWFAVAQGSGLHFIYADGGGSSSASNVTSALVLDNSGNVGIGTDSPALQSGGTGLHVNGSSYSEIKFTNSSTGTAATDGTALVTNSLDFGINNREAGKLTFGTSNSTRMTITSNGGVEVGDGTNYGYVKVINDSAVVQYLDRRGTDGVVLEIRHADAKDGQINTLSGRMAIGSNDTGIFFDSTRNCISPFDMTTNDGINATIDIGRTGVTFNNAFLEKVTIEGTSNDEGIYLGSNHRIYGGSNRAFEASTSSGGSVSLGEGYTTGDVRISAPELLYPEDLRFKDDNGILRFTKAVSVGESATTVLTITKSSYTYFIGGTITFILVDGGSPWGVRTQTYSISGRVATYQAGNNMGVSYSLIKETSNMDYTPTLSTVDSRTTGSAGGTYEFKFANGSGNGSSSCKVIFDGYFTGGTIS